MKIFIFIFVLLSTACSQTRKSNDSPPHEKGETTKALAHDLIKTDPTISFLNIGNGSCQVVDCGPNDGAIIFDCGSISRSATDMTDANIHEFIQAVIAKSGKRPRLVVSHPDQDHTNKIAMAFGAVVPSTIFLGGCPGGISGCYDQAPFSGWLQKVRALPQGPNIRESFAAGYFNNGQPESELSCGAASTYVLTTSIGGDPNSRSMMNMIVNGSSKVIFSGDATDKTQKSAVDNFGNALKYSVLSLSHHGAFTEGSNDSYWAIHTEPHAAIASAGPHAGFFHPQCRAFESYEHYLRSGALEHSVMCGDYRNFVWLQTVKDAYNTETSGRISFDLTPNRNNIRILTQMPNIDSRTPKTFSDLTNPQLIPEIQQD